MVKYELRLMFEWGSAADESVIWGMNDAAKEKFGGYDIKLDNLPISVSMKEELMRLHEWHDSALNWEYPPDPSPWSMLNRRIGICFVRGILDLSTSSCLSQCKCVSVDGYDLREWYIDLVELNKCIPEIVWPFHDNVVDPNCFSLDDFYFMTV